MDLKQLADLQEVAAAQFDRDAQDLSAALAEEDSLRAALEALATSQERRAHALTGGIEVAFAQTGEAAWQTWATVRRKDLLMRLAHQQAITAQVKARVRASFGRKSALADLVAKGHAAQAEDARKTDLQALVDLDMGRRWMSASAKYQTS